AEVDLVLQAPGVLGPSDLHGLSRQALELLELAVMKLEPTDALNITHCSGLQSFARSRCRRRSTARCRCGPPRLRRPRAAPRRDPAAARGPRRRGSCIAPYSARRTCRGPGGRAPPSSRPFSVMAPPVGPAGAGPCPGPLRLSSRVDLRAEAVVEADRLEDVERGAGRVDVGGGEDAGVLLDDRR